VAVVPGDSWVPPGLKLVAVAISRGALTVRNLGLGPGVQPRREREDQGHLCAILQTGRQRQREGVRGGGTGPGSHRAPEEAVVGHRAVRRIHRQGGRGGRDRGATRVLDGGQQGDGLAGSGQPVAADAQLCHTGEAVLGGHGQVHPRRQVAAAEAVSFNVPAVAPEAFSSTWPWHR
jgi:hypothetical protein